MEEEQLEQAGPGDPASVDDDPAGAAIDAEEAAAVAVEPVVGVTEPVVEPPSSDAVAEPAESPPAPASAAKPADDQQPSSSPPFRGLKLVVTLQPIAPDAYRVLLAVGADGCDPLLRSAEVHDLEAVLDEVRGLTLEAEARWRTQPRYPAATPKAKPARAGRGKEANTTPTPAATAEPASEAPPARETPTPANQPAGSDQLSLFG